MKKDKAVELIERAISYGIEFVDKSRTVKVADFAQKIMTGKNQDELIIRYRKGETDELKEQRVRLGNSLTKYVAHRPRNYWRKLARVQGVKETIESENKDKLADLIQKMNSFYEGRPLKEFLYWKLEYLNFYDPNSFIIYERRDSRDDEGEILETEIYPIVIPSKDVVDYKNKAGNLEWLMVNYHRVEYFFKDESKEEKQYTDFVLYAAGFTVEYFEVEKEYQPEIDEKLDFTFNKAKKQVINIGLSNTFGFGGHNASIIFRKFNA